MDQPMASVSMTAPGPQATRPSDGNGLPGGSAADAANRPDTLRPVRDLLRRAATAEEDYIRQNAILAWAALIAKCEAEAPGEDAAKVAELVDAVLWRRPEEPALADGAVLRASRDALRALPGAARDEAVNELTKQSRVRDEASKATRAAWLLMAFPPAPGLKNGLLSLFWRFIRRRQQLKDAARPLRAGLIPLFASTCAVALIWSALAWGMVRLAVPDPPGDTLYLHGLLCLPVALMTAWAATPRLLLASQADRIVDALWSALLASVVFILTAYLSNYSSDGPVMAKDDIAAASPLLATALVFAGVAIVRWTGPRYGGMRGAASLAVGAIAGCLGILPAFLIYGGYNVLLQFGSFSRLGNAPAIPLASAYWSLLPVMASAGLGSTWSNTMRVPVLRRLAVGSDSAVRRGGIAGGGIVLVLAIIVFAWGAGVTSKVAVIRGLPPLGAADSTCALQPPPYVTSTVASLPFGQHYPVMVCATHEVAFYSQIAPVPGRQPDTELVLHDASGAQVATGHGVKPPALTYQVKGQFSGDLCLQPYQSDVCAIGRPPNETAAIGMMNLLRSGEMLTGEQRESNQGAVSFTMADDLIALIKQGARGSEEQIRSAHPTSH